MKICYIGNPNDAHAWRWARNLAAWGYDVHFVGCEKRGVEIPPGVAFYDLAGRFNLPKIRFAAYGAALFALVRKLKPDVLHAHTAFGAGWPTPMALWRPTALSVHGSDLFLLEQTSVFHQTLTKAALNRADKILCVCDELKNKALELGVPESKLEVIYLGVDTDAFRPDEPDESFRRKLDLGEGPVFYLCRMLEPLYHPMTAAQAFGEVHKKNPNARLLVPLTRARKDLLAEFKDCLAESGALEAVRFLDNVEDDRQMANRYQISLASISLAGSDSVSQSVRESMACATPVIAGDIPAMRASVKDGHDSLLVPMNDPGALAEAMLRLAEDKTLHQKLSHNALTFVQENCSMEVQKKRLELFYNELAAKKAAK
ncbi:Glycosyltransferase involved in cell wall bisynthesis [Desulfatibacillum alkenivorans DSM 16219]|jgi:glycosyltransferase involved in cell wall biosynthesis|uniref:Glycosyltransferase involved in cell wall bisynthesis n=1 Tax=Desulfatibacillum alkenivorans DSM 16219 TaxID=1121393 RepID=A0A1M6GAW4_9BACT|nr:glycosyltransferase family 4 protein [Desulfatibacillum alkenivorans]SHJ07052.1 Glycosyltransferase involved in cell wall bisynthesis [Desulfatibacillum alkenivorans DSM 16219]